PRTTTISRAAAVRSGRAGRDGVVISGLLEVAGRSAVPAVTRPCRIAIRNGRSEYRNRLPAPPAQTYADEAAESRAAHRARRRPVGADGQEQVSSATMSR